METLRKLFTQSDTQRQRNSNLDLEAEATPQQQERRRYRQTLPLLNYYKIQLNLCFAMFLIPFRLKSVGPNTYKLQYNRVHQCICVLVHVFIMLEYFSMARQIESWSDILKLGGSDESINGVADRRDPFHSLYFVGTFSCIIYGLSFIYTFWFKRDTLARAFELIENWSATSCRQGTPHMGVNAVAGGTGWTGVKISALGVFLCGVYAIFGLTDTTLSQQRHNYLLVGNFSGYFSQLHAETKRFYLLSREEEEDDARTAAGGGGGILYVLTGALTALRIFIRIPRFLLIQMLECMVFSTTLCMRHLVVDFLKLRKAGTRRVSLTTATAAATNIHHQHQEHPLLLIGNGVDEDADGLNSCTNQRQTQCHVVSIGEILSQYDKLKEIVNALNSGVKLLTFVCIGVSLPFYASWSAIVFFEENVKWRHHLHFCFYFGTFFTLLTLAAECNAKSGDFYRWIAKDENLCGIPNNKLTSLLIDMQTNEIALKGSGSIFVVTYRFFGTILSVIVTYTIIILQFQASKRSAPPPIQIASSGDPTTAAGASPEEQVLQLICRTYFNHTATK